MASPKKLIKMTSKWEALSVMKRKRNSLSKPDTSDGNRTSFVAHKGRFVVYTADQKRFLIPLEYLNKMVFIELLKLSEEEFGLEIDGPITLPCDASTMEYILMLIKRDDAKDVDRVFLMSVVSTCCSSLPISHHEQTSDQVLVCGY